MLAALAERTIDRRQELLDAAVRVFARKGFNASRVGDIAEEAGVAHGLLYHYFRSKEEVLETIFSDVWGVLGAEADMQGFSQNGAIRFTGTIPGFTNSGFSRADVQWMGTARLRLGYAFDQSLLYATGGLAFGGVSAASGSIGTDGSTIDTFAGGVSSTRTGWTAGGGYEFALGDDWSTRIEALYYDLGTVSYAVAPQDAGSTAEGLTVNASHHFDGTLVRIGISRWL